jgi:hypothetical protein
MMNARFQVLTAASMKMSVFWDVTPYSLIESNPLCRGALMMEAASTSETCGSVSTRLHSTTSQKTVSHLHITNVPIRIVTGPRPPVS